MTISRRQALPLLGCSLSAPGLILSSCGSTGVELIDRTITLPGTVLYASSRGGKWNLIISDLNSDSVVKLTENIAGNHSRGIWSDDGQTVYLQSDQGDGWKIAVITDISDPAGSFTVLTDAEGEQTFPFLTPEGTKLVYLQKAVGATRPDIHLLDLTSGGDTVLATEINVKDMAFIPSSGDLLVVDGSRLKTIDLETGTVTRVTFVDTAANDFDQISVTVAADGTGWCCGMELNRIVFTLGSFNSSSPGGIARRADDPTAGRNPWEDLHWCTIDGTPYLLVAGLPASGGSQRHIGYINLTNDAYSTRLLRLMVGDNRYPDWTAVVHV